MIQTRLGMKPNLVAQTLKRLAPKLEAIVTLEPKWGKVGQIAFKSGRKRYFRYSTLDLNHVGASDLARDKDYSKFFMQKMGYPVIPGRVFCSKRWALKIGSAESLAAAKRFAASIRWPVVVKPNSSSQGRGVCKVHSQREFEAAFSSVSKIDQMVLVEKFVEGDDYRIVVLDDRVISAYQRIPLSLMGDGKLSIRDLLAQKQRMFRGTGRDTQIDTEDCRIVRKLARANLSLASTLEKGQKIFLLDNANLSSGGDSIDVTSRISEGFKELAVAVTKDMGLRLCGVDLITKTDISRPPVPNCHWIIEINAAPGLDHYASIGAAQKKIVDDLYTAVLKAMDVGV
jgi:D-alanine-D-alanine ligase-like ATP-grasp enzyme